MANENVFLFYAVAMGVWITFVYDILRIFRRVVPHGRFWVSFEDLGFWVFCAAEVFMLMYRESNGTLRWFAVLGALAGMFVYRRTLSVVLVKYVSMGLKKLLELVGRALGFVLKPFKAAGRAARRTVGKAAGKAAGKRRSAWAFVKNKLTVFFKMLKMVVCKQ